MHHRIEDDDLEGDLTRAAAWLHKAGRVAVLTGAGVSAESGLATFRGSGGLWEGHRVEEVATPFAFADDPALVWRFYNARRANLATVRPNPGHHALRAFEDRWGSDRFTLVTQNVDGLHQAAGSRNVLEVHGSIRRVRCTVCGQADDRGTEPLGALPTCPGCQGLLRPGVVWFYEELPQEVWLQAQVEARQCDCFLVIGTSAVVYPAAGLVGMAREAGAKVIEVNVERTPASDSADAGLYGPSGQILPRLADELRRLDGA